MLPNFLIIGAMKAGTTSLYEYLRSHPQIYMPSAKELNFFVAERNWSRGIQWYEDQFRDAEAADAVGEATTHYSRHPQFRGVPERIATVLPNVRLIYVLRHPIERIASEYVYRRLGGWERRPMDVAVRTDPTYVDGSRYAMQIETYLDHISEKQFLILFSTDLKNERSRTMRHITDFLEVHPFSDEDALATEFHRTSEQRMPSRIGRVLRKLPQYDRLSQRVSPRVKGAYRTMTTRPIEEGAREMTPGLRDELKERLAPDVARLQGLLDRDLGGWNM